MTAAQTVYRCGNSYSQSPCAGGVAVDTADHRSSAQKLQTDLATRRDARIADEMEQRRLVQEQVDLAANTPALKPAVPASASTTSGRKSQIKKKRKKQAASKTQSVSGTNN